MKKQLDQLIEWHKKFEVPYNVEQPNKISVELIELRETLMREEIREWSHSFCENNAPERIRIQKQNRAKELADILYVVFGTIIIEGLQDKIEEVFDAVHQSNMSKLCKDGTPFKRADGKILKGENYKEPDLSFLLKEINMQVINIDLTAIANSKKYRKGKNEHNYINLVVSERKEPDRDGNTLSVSISKTKEERDAGVTTIYVGSGKVYGTQVDKPKVVQQESILNDDEH